MSELEDKTAAARAFIDSTAITSVIRRPLNPLTDEAPISAAYTKLRELTKAGVVSAHSAFDNMPVGNNKRVVIKSDKILPEDLSRELMDTVRAVADAVGGHNVPGSDVWSTEMYHTNIPGMGKREARLEINYKVNDNVTRAYTEVADTKNPDSLVSITKAMGQGKE